MKTSAFFLFSAALILSGCLSKDISGQYIDSSLNLYTFDKEGLYKGPLLNNPLGDVTLPYKIEDGLVKTEVAMAGTGMVFKIMDDDSLVMGTTGTRLTKFHPTGEGDNVPYNKVGFRNYIPGSIVTKENMKESVPRLQAQGFTVKNNPFEWPDGTQVEYITMVRSAKPFEDYAGLMPDKIQITIASLDEESGNESVTLIFPRSVSFDTLKKKVMDHFGSCEDSKYGRNFVESANLEYRDCHTNTKDGHVEVVHALPSNKFSVPVIRFRSNKSFDMNQKYHQLLADKNK